MTIWVNRVYSEGIDIGFEGVLFVVDDLGSHPVLRDKQGCTKVPI